MTFAGTQDVGAILSRTFGATGLAMLRVGGVIVAGSVIGACLALKVEGRAVSGPVGSGPVFPGASHG